MKLEGGGEKAVLRSDAPGDASGCPVLTAALNLSPE